MCIYSIGVINCRLRKHFRSGYCRAYIHTSRARFPAYQRRTRYDSMVSLSTHARQYILKCSLYCNELQAEKKEEKKKKEYPFDAEAWALVVLVVSFALGYPRLNDDRIIPTHIHAFLLVTEPFNREFPTLVSFEIDYPPLVTKLPSSPVRRLSLLLPPRDPLSTYGSFNAQRAGMIKYQLISIT